MRKAILIAMLCLISLSLCVQKTGKEEKMLNFSSTFYANALQGYAGEAGEDFFVIAGSRDEAVEKLREIIIQRKPPEKIFSESEEINFVIFRGVFRTGGYGVSVDRVERNKNEFLIYASYKNPEKGAMLIQAFTQPAMVISIGKLDKGNYVARFFVKEGDEDYVEKKRVEFRVE